MSLLLLWRSFVLLAGSVCAVFAESSKRVARIEDAFCRMADQKEGRKELDQACVLVTASCILVSVFVQVDMFKGLSEIGLAGLIPATMWPPSNAVRELATRIRRVSRGADCEFYIAADVRK